MQTRHELMSLPHHLTWEILTEHTLWGRATSVRIDVWYNHHSEKGQNYCSPSMLKWGMQVVTAVISAKMLVTRWSRSDCSLISSLCTTSDDTLTSYPVCVVPLMTPLPHIEPLCYLWCPSRHYIKALPYPSWHPSLISCLCTTKHWNLCWKK